MSEEKLAVFLKSGKDWERLRTSVPGVFVLKLPPYKGAATRLVVEVNLSEFMTCFICSRSQLHCQMPIRSN